jgi:predicted transcriptional regulator of viral defense system
MNAAQAFARLRELGVPVLTTADAHALLGGTVAGATKMLTRLAKARLLTPVRRGLWSLVADIDPLALVEYLTSPAPSYVSLQTAMYRRGLIEQIPAVIYVVSLGKPQSIETHLGTYSIHRVAPVLFGGFEVKKGGIKLATAEKALVDFLYLSGSRSRQFAALPELELPADFAADEAERWMRRIPSSRLRTLVSSRWNAWVKPRLRRRHGRG